MRRLLTAATANKGKCSALTKRTLLKPSLLGVISPKKSQYSYSNTLYIEIFAQCFGVNFKCLKGQIGYGILYVLSNFKVDTYQIKANTVFFKWWDFTKRLKLNTKIIMVYGKETLLTIVLNYPNFVNGTQPIRSSYRSAEMYSKCVFETPLLYL